MHQHLCCVAQRLWGFDSCLLCFNGCVCVCNVACQQGAMQKMCCTLAIQVLCSRHQPHLSCLWQVHGIPEGSIQWCLESPGWPLHFQAAAIFNVLPGLSCMCLLLLLPNLETISLSEQLAHFHLLLNERGNNSLLFLQGWKG